MYKLLFLIFLATFSIYAQFGKNKVQYEEFSWKYISSDNFDVYFHDGGEYLAKYCAIESEKALKIIEGQLNYRVQNRIPIILFNSHNQFQQNNVIDQFLSEGIGGVTQLFKNRVVLPFSGDYYNFKHVIHHELVHGVLNDMFHGGSLQNSISQGGYFIPTWLNEGFAEYSSLDGFNTETDMFMRDLTINENLPSLDRISGYLSYRAGQTFYWYISNKYGKEKVGDFINRLKIQRNVDRAFQASFQMSVEDFSDMWQRDIKKYYFPELDKFQSPKDFAVQITDRKKMNNFYNSSPSISPDGKKMAFISDDDGLLGIAVMEIEKAETKKFLVSSFRQQDFEDLNMLTPGISWNPSGTHIAVSAKAGGEDAIFIIDTKTSDYKKIKLGYHYIGSVNWSPDGTKLAFVASKNEQSDVYTYEIKTQEVQNITNDIFSDMMPVWSPDSKDIYFISDRADNVNDKLKSKDISLWDHDVQQSDIYKVNLSNLKVDRITFDSKNKKTSIAISKDQNKILYVSDKNGISNLFELDIVNNRITPKTNSLSAINHISLSSDDSKLLFGIQTDGGYEIFMLRYPFDINLGINELPLTRYKKELSGLDTAKNELFNKILELDKKSNEEELFSYGDFQISFEDDKLVEPNPEAAKSINLNDITKRKDIDTTFNVKDYKLKFTPDIVLGNPGYNTFLGVQGVTQAQFSDMLGNHKIFLQANLLLDLRNSTFFAQYSYLPGVIDYNFNGYHSAAWVVQNFNPTVSNQASVYRYRDWGFGSSGSYPFDLFNRFEFGVTYKNISRSNIQDPTEEALVKNLIVPEVKFVHDNTLGYMYAPTIGNRYYLKLFGTPKLGSTGTEFLTAKFDFRQYVPFTSWINFAFRATGGASVGRNPLTFRLGGTENWINRSFSQGFLPFYEPEDFAFMQFEMPIRGPRINAIDGSKFGVFNAEMRFPLFQALVAGPVPILIQGVMGSFFLDVGVAWDDEFKMTAYDVNGTTQYRDFLMSSGIGIRSFLLGLPLKVDIAWQKNYNGWTKPVYLFSLGFDW